MSVDLEKLSEQLSVFTLGQRAWFWLCPGVTGLPALLLAPFRGDPLVVALRERLKGARVPAGASPVVGLCMVGEDGVFRFAGTSVSEGGLVQLAAWVREHAEAWPELRRLYGAQLLLVDEKMNVQLTISDPAVWEGVEPTMVPGSVAETIQTIHTLAPGERAWFWATDSGPGRQPFLIVEPIIAGAKVQSLNRRVEGAVLERGTPWDFMVRFNGEIPTIWRIGGRGFVRRDAALHDAAVHLTGFEVVGGPARSLR